MMRTVSPGPLSGTVAIPCSKSQAHRLLLCAALGKEPVDLAVNAINDDILATARCLAALGAEVTEKPSCLSVTPISRLPAGECVLPCGESGSTLRFLLPVVGALGAKAVFCMEGRLPQRPLAPLDRELERHGMTLRKEADRLHCEGPLRPGAYTLPGNVSSQYISGLLMALPRLDGDSTLTVTGMVESAAYIDMTIFALKEAGISLQKQGNTYEIPGNQACFLPPCCTVEGDWSSAAAFLCAGALSEPGVTITGLRADSLQADKAVVDLLRRFGAEVKQEETRVTVRKKALRGIAIDAAQFPDLVPVLAALACGAEGETRIYNAGRLRLKESDRLAATATALGALGAEIAETDDGLRILGRPTLPGGEAPSFRDHRIAMAAAVAAGLCAGPVTVTGSECVNKSYPAFWEDLFALKGGSL